MSPTLVVAAAVALAFGLPPQARAEPPGKARGRPGIARQISACAAESANNPASGSPMHGERFADARKSDRGLLNIPWRRGAGRKRHPGSRAGRF